MPKRKQLVCEHLENVSRKLLEQYQDIVRRCVHKRPGVYALYRRKKLYYVGLASSLSSRLAHHLKDRHQHSWDRFSVYLTISDSHYLKELESLILRVIKPRGNKTKGRFVKSTDMLRRVRRMAREEVDEIFYNPSFLKEKKTFRRKVKGRQPILARYTNGPMVLQAQHKGKMIRAYVRKSGLIWFDHTHFTSPSLAGKQAVKRMCNGWHFWKYQRAPGDWVPLDKLRK